MQNFKINEKYGMITLEILLGGFNMILNNINNLKQKLEDKETQSEENQNTICEAKEKEIIDLYAKQNGISEEEAELIYHQSKLKNIIRDTKNGLYLESPYFILERYSEYMIPINKSIIEKGYQRPKITQETIDFIKRHPELHMNCPVLYQMGKIYKDGEFEERSDKVLSRKLP